MTTATQTNLFGEQYIICPHCNKQITPEYPCPHVVGHAVSMFQDATAITTTRKARKPGKDGTK